MGGSNRQGSVRSIEQALINKAGSQNQYSSSASLLGDSCAMGPGEVCPHTSAITGRVPVPQQVITRKLVAAKYLADQAVRACTPRVALDRSHLNPPLLAYQTLWRLLFSSPRTTAGNQLLLAEKPVTSWGMISSKMALISAEPLTQPESCDRLDHL